jgi:hypothetical protein
MPPYRLYAMNVPTQLMYSTVRVELAYGDGAVGSGTAFFCSHHKPGSSEEPLTCLVTNRHVLDGAVRARFQFHTVGSTQWHDFSVGESVKFEHALPQAKWIAHPDDNIDLCAIDVEDLTSLAQGALKTLFFSPISTGLIPSEEEERRYWAVMEVMMIGSPTGLWDEVNNLPILRRGSTATHPAIDYGGEPEFVVDMACFPGSSGSPVVSHDNSFFGGSSYRFFGVLYAGPTMGLNGTLVRRAVPTIAAGQESLQVMVHLGYVVKARKVRDLLEHIEMLRRSSG